MKHFAVFAVVSAALPYVASHGFVSQVIIDGQTYEGNVPNDYQGTYTWASQVAAATNMEAP